MKKKKRKTKFTTSKKLYLDCYGIYTSDKKGKLMFTRFGEATPEWIGKI